MARTMPPPAKHQWLTHDQEISVRRAIANGATRDEAAATAGITPARLWARLRDQLQDVRVGQGRRGRRVQAADPDPAEIAERCRQLRERWSPERLSEASLFFNGSVNDS
jgi:hypothetical protein